jgi:hypothetical protein
MGAGMDEEKERETWVRWRPLVVGKTRSTLKGVGNSGYLEN